MTLHQQRVQVDRHDAANSGQTCSCMGLWLHVQAVNIPTDRLACVSRVPKLLLGLRLLPVA